MNFMKYILLIVTIFSLKTSFAQELRVDKFRVIESGMYFRDEKPEYGDTDFLVAIISKEYMPVKVNIFAKKEIQYDIIKLLDTYTDEKNVSWGIYECLDDDGNKIKFYHGLSLINPKEYLVTMIFSDNSGGNIFYKYKIK